MEKEIIIDEIIMPKIKGSHTAMKSGIIAAESIIENIKNKKDLSLYEEKFSRNSF